MPNEFDYDVIFVGRGYSIATYLLTADLDWAQNFLLVGGPDSWDTIMRGDGVVNHARYIYARTALERQSLVQAPTLRPELVNSNRRIVDFMRDILTIRNKTSENTDVFTDKQAIVTKIDVATTTLSEAIVRKSGREIVYTKKVGDRIPIYHVTYSVPNEDDKTVRALKVVYGGGAGPQRRPAYVTELLETQPLLARRAMDLDTFMHFYGGAQPLQSIREKKSVALVGPNAGIDGVFAALNQGFELFWLVASEPQFLATQHYTIDDGRTRLDGPAAVDRAKQCLIKYKRGEKSPEIELGYKPDKFSIKIPGALQPNESPELRSNDHITRPDGDLLLNDLDMFVYAIGQDPGLSEYIYPENDPSKQILLRVGPAQVLAPVLSKTKLWPIYDVNERFGRSYETVVGLQFPGSDKYNGLEVVGAAAFALASQRSSPYVTHAYFAQWPDIDSTVEPADTKETLSRALESAGKYFDQIRRYGESLIEFLGDKPPSVAQSMTAIKNKLNQQSVTTADQLGAVRAQVEALTGYDLRVQTTAVWYMARLAQEFLKATAEPTKPGLKVWGDALVAALQSSSWTTVLAALRSEDARVVGEKAIQDVKAIQRTPGMDPAAVRRQVTKVIAYLEKVAARESIDFNGMDRTELAVALGAAYPEIIPSMWEGIIQRILDDRKKSEWGYGQSEVQKLRQWLECLNELALD